MSVDLSINSHFLNYENLLVFIYTGMTLTPFIQVITFQSTAAVIVAFTNKRATRQDLEIGHAENNPCPFLAGRYVNNV